MAKKLTKEELEQDPLLQSYAKIQNTYQENKSTIIGGAIALVLAICLGVGYVYYSNQQEQEAQELMTSADQYFMNGNYEQALQGSEEEFTVGFEQIIDNFSGTDAANLARYYAAVSHYNLGNIEQALSYMNSYEVPDGILGVAPISFHAVLYAELGDLEQAAQMYVRAAEWDENSSTTPHNYVEAAQAFNEVGNNEQARTYVQRVLNEYPNSPQVDRAQRLMGTLMAVDS